MTNTDTAEGQAKAQLESIVEMLARLEHIRSGDCDAVETNEFCELFKASSEYDLVEFHDEDAAREAIDQDPLSVETRSGWHTPGEASEDVEFKILLCWGGPAVRIIGEFDMADSVRLEYQDWGTPWTEYITTGSDHAALIEYANCFLGI